MNARRETRGAAAAVSGRHPLSRPPASAPRPLFALLALGVLLVTFSAGLAPLLARGADDLGLVGVLSTDEELAARIVRHMLVVRRPDPNHFFAYGALAHELTALALVPAALIGTVSDTTVIAVARGTSLAGGVATVALTGVLAWRLFGAPAGVAAAALLAATPELAVWSVTAHPDTVQLALLTAALLVAVDLPCAPTRRRLAVCGVLAGLAFGTKYLGALALPLLLVAAIAGRRRAGAPPLTVRTVAADAAVLGAAFATAFAITNPYALAEPLRALGQVREEAARARAGHVFAGAGRLGWLGAFASPALGGPALPALAGPAAVFYLGRRTLTGAGVVALWLLGYALYLLTQVGYDAPRHALPLLPAGAALAGGAIAAGARRVAGVRPWAPAVLVAVVTVMAVAAPLAATAGRTAALHAEAQALSGDPRVQAGRWLAAEAAPAAVILRDAYVYLPPERAGAPVTFGLTATLVDEVRPDYIVVNEQIRGRFRWEVGAERYVDGPAAYWERMAAYAMLEEGRLGDYLLLRDFGSVQVYGRRDPR